MAKIATAPAAATALPRRPRRSALDFATLLGVAAAFSLIGAAVYLGGSPGSFVDIPALLIVLGGTFAVTTISYSFAEVMVAQRIMLKAVISTRQDPGEATRLALRLADMARRGGLLGLQNVLPQLRDKPLLQRGLGMAVDGTPAEDIEQILQREVAAMSGRHMRSAGVLRRAAEVSPAMGLIGTLVGLVQMLGNLDDPSAIGPSMAVALLTTFYGAVLANMLFSPVAAKLERNSGEEALVDAIHVATCAAIARQDNPRRLELVLNTMLPPAQRVRHFD